MVYDQNRMLHPPDCPCIINQQAVQQELEGDKLERIRHLVLLIEVLRLFA
jgi:hypothetical protein